MQDEAWAAGGNGILLRIKNARKTWNKAYCSKSIFYKVMILLSIS